MATFDSEKPLELMLFLQYNDERCHDGYCGQFVFSVSSVRLMCFVIKSLEEM